MTHVLDPKDQKVTLEETSTHWIVRLKKEFWPFDTEPPGRRVRKRIDTSLTKRIERAAAEILTEVENMKASKICVEAILDSEKNQLLRNT